MLKKNDKSKLLLSIVGIFASSTVHAIEIDTGNPDVSVRFDNTVRYSVAQRVENRDNLIGNSPLADEGDYRFNKNDLVSNRFDLLSEFDFVYKKQRGFRVSAAGWYDAAYDGNSRQNPSIPFPSYKNNQYSSYVKRYYAGPSGEILDAFVFDSFNLGGVDTNVKLGRHTLYWGESLFLSGNVNSVAYAQSPIDLQKGFSIPGSEAKELFRPLNQLSAQAQVTDTVSVAAEYMLQWEANRFSEGGTYLGAIDAGFEGPNGQFVQYVTLPGGAKVPVYANRGEAIHPRQGGDFGLSTHWTPAWLDGTMGFYYRKFSDKLPQVLITKGGLSPQYNLVYADNIDLYGMSLSKNIGGVSVGAEVSYRHNTPLLTQTFANVGATPTSGDTLGAKGDTWHALVNGVGSIARTPLFDSATWAAELAYSRWDKVTSGAQYFQAIGFGGCPKGGGVAQGCATKEFVGLSAAFTPTWYQVFPGMDLSAPITYSIGLMGNAATTFGGNKQAGNYSVGLGLDVYQKYRFDLKYIDYLGQYQNNGTAVTSTNGLTALLKDRGFLSLTFKTTF